MAAPATTSSSLTRHCLQAVDDCVAVGFGCCSYSAALPDTFRRLYSFAMARYTKM